MTTDSDKYSWGETFITFLIILISLMISGAFALACIIASAMTADSKDLKSNILATLFLLACFLVYVLLLSIPYKQFCKSGKVVLSEAFKYAMIVQIVPFLFCVTSVWTTNGYDEESSINQKNRFHIVTNNARGIKVGDKVFIESNEIGSIDSIQFLGDNYDSVIISFQTNSSINKLVKYQINTFNMQEHGIYLSSIYESNLRYNNGDTIEYKPVLNNHEIDEIISVESEPKYNLMDSLLAVNWSISSSWQRANPSTVVGDNFGIKIKFQENNYAYIISDSLYGYELDTFAIIQYEVRHPFLFISESNDTYFLKEGCYYLPDFDDMFGIGLSAVNAKHLHGFHLNDLEGHMRYYNSFGNPKK